MSDEMASGFDGWSDEEIADYWQQIHEHRHMMSEVNRRIEQTENQPPPEAPSPVDAGVTGEPAPPHRHLRSRRCNYT